MILGAGLASPAAAQNNGAAPDSTALETTTAGTIVSSTRTTLVVRTPESEYKLFELTPDTLRPEQLPPAAAVEVAAHPARPDGAPLATRVKVMAAGSAATGAATQAPAAAQTTPQTDEPIPPELRRLEQNIVRQTSRYRVGARGGMGLDPELVMIGAQAQVGPFFTDKLWARPNLEFGFGEVTTLIALNLDGVFRVGEPGSRWTPFFGAGLGFNFVNEGFSGEGDEGERFDFDNFVYDTGLNLMAGVQSRAGMMLELRAGVYAEPHLRLVVGWNFW
jgi:hypothetical protein